MERGRFTREFKLEAVRLIKDRGVSRRRTALIAANDNASRDASEWRTLWLPVLAILALPMAVLAAIIAGAVFL
jgi:hypothetical protein